MPGYARDAAAACCSTQQQFSLQALMFCRPRQSEPDHHWLRRLVLPAIVACCCTAQPALLPSLVRHQAAFSPSTLLPHQAVCLLTMIAY